MIIDTYHKKVISKYIIDDFLKIKKKCTNCGELTSLDDFGKDKSIKSGIHSCCKKCRNKRNVKYYNTESGYLRKLYNDMCRNDKWRATKTKCYISFEELYAAFKKHKSIYGMKSAWGPGIDHLDQHLPITMIFKGDSAWKRGEGKRTASNLSVDRLDSSIDYTLQNIIFIRGDENARKKDTSYEDCKIQIRLHEERFINI